MDEGKGHHTSRSRPVRSGSYPSFPSALSPQPSALLDMSITRRVLRKPSEFAQAQEVARSAWKFSDLELPPVADLQMVGHIGGFTAGAFEDGQMLGFVHGVPRTNLREPAQHSHLLAVTPAARGRSLASRLKFFQRDWCLERG